MKTVVSNHLTHLNACGTRRQVYEDMSPEEAWDVICRNRGACRNIDFFWYAQEILCALRHCETSEGTLLARQLAAAFALACLEQHEDRFTRTPLEGLYEETWNFLVDRYNKIPVTGVHRRAYNRLHTKIDGQLPAQWTFGRSHCLAIALRGVSALGVNPYSVWCAPINTIRQYVVIDDLLLYARVIDKARTSPSRRRR